MPTDVIPGPRVEIESVRVRILCGRGLEGLASKLRQPVEQGRRTVQGGDERSQPIDRVPADTPTLLVSGQVISVDGGLDEARCFDEADGELRRQEGGQGQECALLDEVAAQRARIERSQARGEWLLEVRSGRQRACRAGRSFPRAKLRAEKADQAAPEVDRRCSG